MDNILLLIITVIFSAFFSGTEIAFLSANRLRIELDRKQGVFGGRIAALFVRNPGQFISTMLVGNNIALIVFGLIFSRLISPTLMAITDSDAATLIIQTVLSTLIILLVAEFLPKNLFILSPNMFLRSLGIPAAFFYYVFFPVSKFFLWLSAAFIRIFSGKSGEGFDNENIVFSRTELDHFVSMMGESENADEAETRNIKIFRNALEFPNVKLRECMIPRTEITAMDVNSSIPELRQKFINTGYSKIPVFENSIDNIIGYFELTDLFKSPADIRSSLRKIAIVPETMAANKLLRIFVEDKRSVALVVDEFGGTAGIVTIEDVLEEIVGDIEDEHDISDITEKQTGPGEYILSGRLDVGYLNEQYALNLPENDDYETLAGLIFYYYGSIPKLHEVIKIGPAEIKVLKVSSTRLELVSLKITG